jgi:hypothetical protein
VIGSIKKIRVYLFGMMLRKVMEFKKLRSNGIKNPPEKKPKHTKLLIVCSNQKISAGQILQMQN